MNCGCGHRPLWAHQQLALSFTHLFLPNPRALSKYVHFSASTTQVCTLLAVHRYLCTYQQCCWEGEKTLKGKKKKVITRKGKTVVTQFSKVYGAWHSALRRTPRYSASYLKHVQTICTPWVCKAELEIGQARLFWYCLFLAETDRGW